MGYTLQTMVKWQSENNTYTFVQTLIKEWQGHLQYFSSTNFNLT
jgi:hypothetical protein